MTTRIWKVTFGGDYLGDHTRYYMTYSAAVLSLVEEGYELRKDADPAQNTKAWLTDDGIFGPIEAWIGWIDVEGRCPTCEAEELARRHPLKDMIDLAGLAVQTVEYYELDQAWAVSTAKDSDGDVYVLVEEVDGSHGVYCPGGDGEPSYVGDDYLGDYAGLSDIPAEAREWLGFDRG